MRSLQTQAQWCNRAQWVLGLSLAAMVMVFYAFIYRPNNERLQDLRDQIDAKELTLTNNKARVQILPDVLVAVNQMRARLEQFDKKIPDNPELGAFISDITDLSHQAGLQSRWAVDPGQSQHTERERFAVWPIALKFEGNFLNACVFLRRAEQMQRLTRLKGLKIHSLDGGKNGAVQVELSMNIYYVEG